MESALISPAKYIVLGMPLSVLGILIPAVGIAVFAYIIFRRAQPLLRAAPDYRFNRVSERALRLCKFWLAQWRQPRYLLGGVLHILIFAGFIVLSLRSINLVIIGFWDGFVLPGMDGVLGDGYHFVKDYAATWVLVACVIAGIRRGVFKPARYAVPAKYGHEHTGEALFVLGLISTLMISESLFEGAHAAAQARQGLSGHDLPPLTLIWLFAGGLRGASLPVLQGVHVAAYLVHDLTFFFFLCFLPLGKHFHVITSIFNVFFMRLDKGDIKPVKHGVSDAQLDDLESFGVKRFEDFTWKHMLDFYSCADCGRCSDQCPANAVGRPLSPRFISIKGRDYAFANYPLRGGNSDKDAEYRLVGDIYEENEIWSCTTCGACEEECPLGIEYIDKIVDLRRGMVDDGLVPQSLQKPLRAIEKRGNPWGKLEKKRVDWTKSDGFDKDYPVKVLGKKANASVLYFVDSISSYDDRMQDIARATAKVLTHAGIDFGILGKAEKDSGHEVRRFGEEMLFQELKAQNTEAILASGAERIITADPHAYNGLKKDYAGLPPVEHISQVILRSLRSRKLRLKAAEPNGKIYTYHDPCYLGRHNGIYDEPRKILDAIEGLRRVEMDKCRDRSFCCGGGGLMLFYEPEEEQRMGVLRVRMASDAGANMIVTNCPFCLVNLEDAIKVAGFEGQIEAVDLTELVERHLADD